MSVHKSKAIRFSETQLKRKWKVMRDYFQRFRRKPHKRNKPHMYSNKLQFLIKNEGFSKRKNRSNADSSSKSDESSKAETITKPKRRCTIRKDEEVSSEEDNSTNNSTLDIPEDSRDSSNDDHDARQGKSAKMNKSYVEDAEFAFDSIDPQSKSDAGDPDRLFLLSLLPHLKTIPEELRLNVKMELMQVLRSANYSMAREHKVI